MRILLYVFISCIIMVLGFLAFTRLPNLQIAPDLIPTIRGPAIAGFLAGIIGGLLGSRLLVPALPEDDSGKWKLELRKLREDFESDRRVRMVEQRNQNAHRSFTDSAAARSSTSVEQHSGPATSEWTGQNSRDRSDDGRARSQSRPSLGRSEIMARYRETVSGTISRSGFSRFFEDIGRSGPVDAEAGGRRIVGSLDDEGFLVSVSTGDELLVFPSYNFVANQETQFNTIASVPETIASVFDLVRGDGEIALATPAVYIADEDGAVLRSKGEIRGFSG